MCSVSCVYDSELSIWREYYTKGYGLEGELLTDEGTVVDMKRSLNMYLEDLEESEVRSLAEVIGYNSKHADAEHAQGQEVQSIQDDRANIVDPSQAEVKRLPALLLSTAEIFK